MLVSTLSKIRFLFSLPFFYGFADVFRWKMGGKASQDEWYQQTLGRQRKSAVIVHRDELMTCEIGSRFIYRNENRNIFTCRLIFYMKGKYINNTIK